jgi:hypothetical protein
VSGRHVLERNNDGQEEGGGVKEGKKEDETTGKTGMKGRMNESVAGLEE